MMMKIGLAVSAAMVLTACGGSDGDSIQDKAIDKIVAYAQNGGTVPTLQDYIDAGVVGLDESRLANINEVVSNLTQEEVDTTEEIQALADALGVSVPEETVLTPAPRTQSTPTPTPSSTQTPTPTQTQTTSAPTPDTTSPVITMVGGASINVVQFSTYTDAGATATDDVDSSVTVTSTGTVDTDTVGVYDINYTATDTAGNSATEIRTVTITAFSITHKTITYGAVRSPYNTGKVWLDRNLGAAQVCTSFDDTACYGYYYQWGRNHDGHQLDDADIPTTPIRVSDVNNLNNVGHGDFIKGSSDWASVDDSGATRTANWSATEGNSVCPDGFRVPTIGEFTQETIDNGVTNRDTAFINFLKLPSAGNRNNLAATLFGQGSWGIVWASSADGSNSHIVYFYSGGALSDSNNRAYGYSVRCLRD